MTHIRSFLIVEKRIKYLNFDSILKDFEQISKLICAIQILHYKFQCFSWTDAVILFIFLSKRSETLIIFISAKKGSLLHYYRNPVDCNQFWLFVYIKLCINTLIDTRICIVKLIHMQSLTKMYIPLNLCE